MDTSITLPASCESKASVRHSDRSESQTVLRACEVLKTFHAGELELSSAEVIRRTHLPKTTVLRLLRTLVHGGVLERSSGGIYRSAPLPFAQRSLRIGFASQDDSEFARTILQHLQVAAAREHVHLITVDNRYSAREAIRNAEYLIRQEVDLVLEFQTYERIAPILASKFMQAKTPVIAIDIPHPGATYFGANNHRAGVMGGRALGRWAREHWNDKVDRLLMLELPIAGPLVELRMQGFLAALHIEHPTIANVPMIRLNGRGESKRSTIWCGSFCDDPRCGVPLSVRSTIRARSPLCARLKMRAPLNTAQWSGKMECLKHVPSFAVQELG